MLVKAIKVSSETRDFIVAAVAQDLPFKADSVHAAIYFASLHHIPKADIFHSLKDCQRILKPNGRIVVVEPVARKDSYFEVIRLAEDEREIQAYAYSKIKSAARDGLRMIQERFVFFERKYRDYEKLIETFIDDQSEARKALSEGKKVFSRYAQDRGVAWDDFSFHSHCRINILEKTT
jgi:ubiquinone/menaquinone biosynthesis C-methylase UbiE